MSISLSVYSLRVRNTVEKTEISDLTNIYDGNESRSLVDMFIQVLENFSEEYTQQELQRSIAKSNNLVQHPGVCILTGEIQSGKYGFYSEIVSIEDGETKHKKTSNEAEVLPFNFCLICARNRGTAVLVLQNFDIFGIKTVLEEMMNEALKTILPSCKLKFNAEVPAAIIKGQLGADNALIKKIILRKNSAPDDIASNYGGISKKGEDYPAELTLSVKRGGNYVINKIKELFEGRVETVELEMPEELEYFNNPDAFLIEMDIAGKKRTVNLKNWKDKALKIDISDEIGQNDIGQYDRNAIEERCISLAKSVAEFKWGAGYDCSCR